MAYWWVNQGDNHQKERDGGYLWAPLVTKRGASRPDWSNMAELRAGDIVFTYSEKRLNGFCVVTADAISWKTPYPHDYGSEREGRLALAQYHAALTEYSYKSLVTPPPNGLGISLAGARPKLALPDKPTQGYLYSLPSVSGDSLWAHVSDPNFVMPDPAYPALPIGPTTKLRLATARIGQGEFGRGVRDAFGSCCGITGLSIKSPFVLHAAHIKPWVDCDDREKLDPSNGILLHATLHHAFDAGLLEVNEHGTVIPSNSLNAADLVVLGLSSQRSLPQHTLTPRRVEYLRLRLKKGK